MKRKVNLSIFPIFIWFISIISVFAAPDSQTGALVVNRGSHYRVLLDYTTGITRRQMGADYATAIMQVVPEMPSLIDSYLNETTLNAGMFRNVLQRVDDMKLLLHPDYKEEIEGMASVLCAKIPTVRGDGKLSSDELYLFNLYPDVYRGSQCSFISVFNQRSATGRTLTARCLDWYGGSQNQLARIQAVIDFIYPDRKLCSIGYLGYMGLLTGVNDAGVFAGILDSTTGAPYNAQGKRSYPLDLRLAMETENSMSTTVTFMQDPLKYYTVNHLIAFSSPTDSVVLENNFSGSGTTKQRVKRAVRTSTSRLNNRISWEIDDAIGCVNSFLLYGNHDNHTRNRYNTKRWANMKKELLAKGPTVTLEELKEVISCDNGTPGTFLDSGDIYNLMTQQIVLFEPGKSTMEIYFYPNKGLSPKDPVFETITLFEALQ